MTSLNVTQRRILASGSATLNSFSSVMPRSTSSRESIARSSCKVVSGDKAASLPICSVMIFSTREATFSCVKPWTIAYVSSYYYSTKYLFHDIQVTLYELLHARLLQVGPYIFQ